MTTLSSIGKSISGALKKVGNTVAPSSPQYFTPPTNTQPTPFTPNTDTSGGTSFDLNGQYASSGGSGGGGGGSGSGSSSVLSNLALMQAQDMAKAQADYNKSLGGIEMKAGQQRLDYIGNNYQNQLQQMQQQYGYQTGQFNQGLAASGAFTSTGANQTRSFMGGQEALSEKMLGQSKDYQTAQVRNALSKQYAQMVLSNLSNYQSQQYNNQAMTEAGIKGFYDFVNSGGKF